MSLAKRLSQDLKDAMRAKDSVRKSTLRLVLTGITNAEKDRRRELKDDEILEVISREAKKRREAASQYQRADRNDLADREKEELKVLEGYLPRQLSRSEIEEIVRPVVDKLGRDPSKMGLVMRDVMPQVKGRADGKLVNQVVRELLQEKS